MEGDEGSYGKIIVPIIWPLIISVVYCYLLACYFYKFIEMLSISVTTTVHNFLFYACKVR